jgi:hypothetical protein
MNYFQILHEKSPSESKSPLSERNKNKVLIAAIEVRDRTELSETDEGAP